MLDNKRVHLLISGRVQGVLFRQHARTKALELGLAGFAKNLIDGKVEIIVEGPKGKVEEFVEWAKSGPLLARVDNVEMAEEEYTGEFEDFVVREFGF
ncbi:acylphosphatase [Patescibacteria group bacterium]|nr:acylphosphatase [Patescibacteria group bacterium]